MKQTAFTKRWLAADTFVAGMTPAGHRKMRALCKQFYEAGITDTNVPKTSSNMPNPGTTQGATP
jgi:hypothetical protein